MVFFALTPRFGFRPAAPLGLRGLGSLQEVEQACAKAPQSAHDMLPVLFKRELDLHQTTFAMGESVAHLHALWFAGKVVRRKGQDGILVEGRKASQGELGGRVWALVDAQAAREALRLVVGHVLRFARVYVLSAGARLSRKRALSAAADPPARCGDGNAG